MSSLEQFTVFKEVAETGNITQASRHLHISQPSVSIQIRNLEREYGVKLLERTNKGVALTDCGRFFYEKVTSVIQTLNETKETIRILANESHNSLHLGMTLTIGNYLLAPIMGLPTHPGYDDPRFNVFIANTQTIAEAVLDKKINIGLIEGPVPDYEDLIIERFWSDELVVAVGKTHPWASLSEVTFEELKEQPLILREIGSGTRKTMDVYLQNHGHDPENLNVVAELSSIQAIKEAVVAGRGITLMSTLALEEDVRYGRLSILRLSEGPITRPLNIIRNVKSTLSEEEEWFLKQLKSQDKLAGLISNPFKEKESHHPLSA